MSECNICFEEIGIRNRPYLLQHHFGDESQKTCESIHVYDSSCVQQLKSCPFCRWIFVSPKKADHSLIGRVVEKLVDFPKQAFAKIKLTPLNELVTYPCTMLLLEKITAFVIPIPYLDTLTGNVVGGVFGGFTALLFGLGGLMYTVSKEENFENGLSFITGVAAAYLAFGYNSIGAKVGSACMALSGTLNLVTCFAKKFRFF